MRNFSETAKQPTQLVSEELEDIERLRREFFARYKKHYRLSVVAAFLVISITASIAVLAQIEFTGSNFLVSSSAALAAVLSSIDHIFGCKDRARRHLRASQELAALEDRAKYTIQQIVNPESREGKDEDLFMVLKDIAEEKNVIDQQYLRIDRAEGWLPAKQSSGT